MTQIDEKIWSKNEILNIPKIKAKKKDIIIQSSKEKKNKKFDNEANN